MAIALCIMFIASKSPVDIAAFQSILDTSDGFSVVNKRPDELGETTSFVVVKQI